MCGVFAGIYENRAVVCVLCTCACARCASVFTAHTPVMWGVRELMWCIYVCMCVFASLDFGYSVCASVTASVCP